MAVYVDLDYPILIRPVVKLPCAVTRSFERSALRPPFNFSTPQDAISLLCNEVRSEMKWAWNGYSRLCEGKKNLYIVEWWRLAAKLPLRYNPLFVIKSASGFRVSHHGCFCVCVPMWVPQCWYDSLIVGTEKIIYPLENKCSPSRRAVAQSYFPGEQAELLQQLFPSVSYYFFQRMLCSVMVLHLPETLNWLNE